MSVTARYGEDAIGAIQEAKAIQGRIPTFDSKEELFRRINVKQCNLPSVYRPGMWKEMGERLQQRHPSHFPYIGKPIAQRMQLLMQNGHTRKAAAEIARDMESAHVASQLFLQVSEGFREVERSAYQKLACGMWNTFVRQTGSCPSDNCLPPVVIFSEDDDGPVATSYPSRGQLKIGNRHVPYIRYPVGYSETGTVAATTLAHEVAHTILVTQHEAVETLRAALEQNLGPYVHEYWSSRVHELVADVMAVLCMGPAAADGLIAYFRAGQPGYALSTVSGPEHPAGIWRSLVLLHAVNALDLQDDDTWAVHIAKTIGRDESEERLGMELKDAMQQARIVAQTLMHTPVLHGRSLARIRQWNATDQQIVGWIREKNPIVCLQDKEIAPHIVAASTMDAMQCEGFLAWRDLRQVFHQMITRLNESDVCKDGCPIADRTFSLVCPSGACGRSENAPQEMESDQEGWSTGEKIAGGLLGVLAVGGGVWALSNKIFGGEKKSSRST